MLWDFFVTQDGENVFQYDLTAHTVWWIQTQGSDNGKHKTIWVSVIKYNTIQYKRDFFFYPASRWRVYHIKCQKVQTEVNEIKTKYIKVKHISNVKLWIHITCTDSYCLFCRKGRIWKMCWFVQTDKAIITTQNTHFCSFSITLTLSQRPLLIIVKVGVSPNTLPRSKGMSQEAIFAIEGVTISMLCWWYHSILKDKNQEILNGNNWYSCALAARKWQELETRILQIILNSINRVWAK